ncbi:MAG: hypothetical protein WD040_08100 [Anaerolineales bacterium]
MRVPPSLARGTVLLRRVLTIFLLGALLTRSSIRIQDPLEHVRRFTRSIEFDFLGWTLDALGVKWAQTSLGLTGYLSEPARREAVLEYAQLLVREGELEGQLAEILGAPSPPPDANPDAVRQELDVARQREDQLEPVVEAILQEQTSIILDQLGLTAAGAPMPPVAFRFSRLPWALIVSPREVVRQDASIQISPDTTLDDQIALESNVERGLNVSALVVPIGGIGTYPTMVQQTPSLGFVAEVVAHEWTHNTLTLQPLGLAYESSAELRTMNETTASLMGKEVGSRTIALFYPSLAPPVPSPELRSGPTSKTAEPPPFDFRAEMHTTRLTVDELLAEGKIDEAERYMEERRQFIWDNGYHLRRLNQAYFAFYGAYADEPGGPAGEDPIGAGVRALWADSASPAQFLRTMARMDEVADLQAELTRRGLTIP